MNASTISDKDEQDSVGQVRFGSEDLSGDPGTEQVFGFGSRKHRLFEPEFHTSLGARFNSGVKAIVVPLSRRCSCSHFLLAKKMKITI